MPALAPPLVLSIAGYDPSAGAGILADLKTFAANGVYGMACITALTVQSTQGVRKIQPLDANFVVETLDCLAEDVRFSYIKVGMLGQHTVAAAVLGWLLRHPDIPVVLDPVLKSSSGNRLLDSEGTASLRAEWLSRIRWITPNLPELAILAGTPVPKTPVETEDTARQLLEMAAKQGNPDLRIVVTGGHAKKPDDLFLTGSKCQWFPGEPIATESTHGTGCTFSSALTAGLACGASDVTAVETAKSYVTEALRRAYTVGRGHGPLNHFWRSLD